METITITTEYIKLQDLLKLAGLTYTGGEAKVNEAENRLQLIFEDKPDADSRPPYCG